jgi:hypothetical protein
MHQMRDTVRQHPRFATARARKDKKRPLCGVDRLALRRIQI